MELLASRPRLPAITSIRFFAALHVVIFHLHAIKVAAGPQWYQNFASIGYVGVSLFFVLSGFILVYTYANRETPARSFWRARFARIYPAYLFSLIVTAPFFIYVLFVMPMQSGGNMDMFVWPKHHPLASALLVPALLQSWIPGAALAWNSVAWSLSVEAFFYLIFPALIVLLMRKRNSTLMSLVLICWALSLTLTLGYTLLNPDHAAFVNDDSLGLTWLNVVKFNPLLRLPEFLMGACCGFLFVRNHIHRKWATPLAVSGLVAFIAVAAFSSHIPYPVIHSGLLAPAFAAIIYGIALRPAWARLLEFKPLVLLGDASYSLYLLHSVVLPMFFQPDFEHPKHYFTWQILMGVFIAIAVSVAVYLGIEEPLRRKLRPKRPQPKLVSAAAEA
jgi:peptidoglycan/LPS O-acetylase OafA/YrhL